MSDQDEFLRLTEQISRLCVDVPEEQLVSVLLPLLCERLTAAMSAEKGELAASLLAQRIVATIFRRRQQILAPVVN